jgi:hypothetical protein
LDSAQWHKVMRRILISLLAGGVLGLGIGLFLGWVQFPVITVNSGMQALSRVDKDRYTVMVAQGFIYDGDLAEAQRRLQPLGGGSIPTYVRDVTERFISESGSGSDKDIRALVALAGALGNLTPPMQAFVAVATATPAP